MVLLTSAAVIDAAHVSASTTWPGTQDGTRLICRAAIQKREEKLTIGHNSTDAKKLKSTIERIERLEEEKAGLADDIKDIYAEAKAFGYDTKTIRKVIKLRKMDADARAEEESLLEIYMNALGMLADTPLGRAAIDARNV